MIQEVLSIAIKHAVAMSPPSDMAWLVGAFGDKQLEFQSKIAADLERGARELAVMKARGAAIREQMWSAYSSCEVLPQHLDVLSWLIEAIEDRAGKDAIDAARRFKRLRKTTKQIEEHEPGLRPFLNNLNKVMKETSRSEVQERLDFALFLRSLLAEFSPPDIAASFTSASELETFLRGELGA